MCRVGYKTFALLILTIFLSDFLIRPVKAAQEEPPGPDRYTVILQDYTLFKWWLIDWSDNQIACEFQIEHEGSPTAGEIFDACGTAIYKTWMASTPCDTAEQDPSSCQGYYLQFNGSEPAQRDVGTLLPPPVVWLNLDGCVPYNSSFRCIDLPILVLIGEEPLVGESISSLAGRIDGKPFTCDAICQVDLPPTRNDGLLIEFWANSTYGDSSELFTARVRVASLDDPNDQSWYVDIISTQWRGAPLAGCSQIWEVFPPVGGTPTWLSTPHDSADLATNIPYEYLSANLIKSGVVDVSSCTDGGLLDSGLASVCGLETARDEVNRWQNRFDELIMIAARDTGVPAQLLKNIFRRESQFWPTAINDRPEAGLGQMTDAGADATLLWNQTFFEQFCPSSLEADICRQGYALLTGSQKELLRSSLVASVDAHCPDCPMGIDLDRADASVGVFAETLIANCAQTDMVVDLNDGNNSGDPITFEDFWRLTLVNYNAGPGCLGLALDETADHAEPLDWEHISSHLTPACQGALDYVTDTSSSTLP